MNDFIERLVALRNGVGNVAKGTLQNMRNVREREQQMLDTERERNREMITNTFGGNPQNYEDFLAEQPPLPKTPGQSLGDFFKRLLELRNQ